jgi:hypothetical protein
MSKIKHAKLFVCASCEWIFKTPDDGCPQCHFGYYTAHYVYGKKAYHNFKAQQPWIDRRVTNLLVQLHHEIRLKGEYKCPTRLKLLSLITNG